MEDNKKIQTQFEIDKAKFIKFIKETDPNEYKVYINSHNNFVQFVLNNGKRITYNGLTKEDYIEYYNKYRNPNELLELSYNQNKSN